MKVSPKKILRKTARVIGWFLLVLVVIFLTVAGALQSPKVQTWVVEKVADTLSQTLGTEARVGEVDIDFFKTAVLHDLFIADQKRDTLFAAREVRVNIGLLDLLGSEIYLNHAEVNGAVVKLYQNEGDSVFNYQFIIDAFAADTTAADTTSGGFTFGIGSAALNDVRFDMREAAAFDLRTHFNKFSVTLDELDLEGQRIDFDEVRLENSRVSLRQFAQDSTALAAAPADMVDLTFPGFGWEVSADKIRLADNQVSYSDDNAPRIENALDFAHLDLKKLGLSINGLLYSDEKIAAEIKAASFTDHSGFRLEELSGGVEMTDTYINMDGLVLRTPASDLRNDTEMAFSEFADLTDFLNRVKLESTFADSRLAVRDLLMLAPDLREVPNLKFPEGGTLTMRGGLVLENEKLELDGLRFAIGADTRLAASGGIAELMGEQKFDLQISELATSHASLTRFLREVELPSGLKKFGTFRLSGAVRGSLRNLAANDLRLTTEAATRFSGDLKITGLPEVETAVFDLKIRDLATRSTDLSGFAEEPLPPQLDSLGLIQFAGTFRGTMTDFAIDGKFKTAAGGATTDLEMDFADDYSDAAYSGQLALQNFDLGKMLGDTSQFGRVSLDTRIEGRGLAPDSLDTRMDGRIERLRFNGYDYADLRVDGAFVRRKFTGQMGMDDPNLGFEFAGTANLNDSLPDFDLKLKLDTVNLAALNFYPEALGLSGQLEAKLRGSDLDNLDGQATLSDFVVESAGTKYFDPHILLKAEQLTGAKRRLLFDAKFLHAKVEGQYRFADLPDLVIGYVNDFFPVEELALPADSTLSPRPKVAEQKFDFEMHFAGLPEVAGVFVPGFTALDSAAYIRGSFDSDGQNLDMTGEFPGIVFDDIRLDTFRLSANGNARRLKTHFALRQLDLNGGFFASQINLDTRLGDDTLRFDLAVLDDTLGQDFRLAGRSEEGPENYHLRLDRTLVLNSEEWEIDRANLVEFSSNGLKISDLVFRKNRQRISIASVGEAPPNDFAPLELRFDNFRLWEISGLLNNPNMALAGRLSGGLTVIEPQTNLHYNADLRVDSLHLNEQPLGQLDVAAAQPPGSQTVGVEVTLSGANEMTLAGEYEVPESRFDLEADIGRLGLVVADPFMVGLMENSEGHLSGNFSLRGTPDRPVLRGKVSTNGVSTRVVMAGTRFTAIDGTISFSEKNIDLGQLTLTDPRGGRATLSGEVMHDYFENIRLGLRAQTDGLQVLNTTSKDNELYWGRLMARADVRIGGTAEEPNIDITATTMDSTLLHVQPLVSDLAVVQEDYIIFADPDEYSGDSLQVLEQKINAGVGIDLSLRLQVTPAAELNVIIDPLTGDQLFCRGSADLIVKMDPAGNLDITGRYVIEEGQYSFAYEGLVKRNFRIRKGSSLTFTGDPLDARFDITAVYDTRATTYELIANESALDEATLSASRRRTDVEVLLNIDGDLAAPEISFDIELPQNQGGVVDNLLTRKLVTLREETTEMNKQVFSLLLFNSFLASESGAGLANVGENAALRSVSNLVSSQLNRLAGRYLRGVDLSVGFESYKAAGEDAGTVSELNVGLSKQLFNDRLTIRVGGNFNLENSQSSEVQAGGTSAIAGDFVLEYKITPQGNYLLRVFHKSDYNILLDANTNKTGVGVMYRKSY